jgi:hypothetical protein
MTDASTTPLDIVASPDDDEFYEPSDELVKHLADHVTEVYGASARLPEVGMLMDTWPETRNLDDGQQEALAEALVDELAARDNGRRR